MTETPPDPTRVASAVERLRKWLATPLSLDLTRGKPAPEQLDLSGGLLRRPENPVPAAGPDPRNYGVPEGLAEARQLFAEILDAPSEQILVGDNASLTLMYQAMSFAQYHGVPGGAGPWVAQHPKVLCPSPGYDRHFVLSEHLGLELITTAISAAHGLDLETVERLARDDASVKAIWIVPKFSNPTGHTLSPDEVDALARMQTAAPDFRILWDNAYAVHWFEKDEPLASIVEACERAGNPNRPWLFGSTSKVTFAGGGISAFGSSAENLEWMLGHRGKLTIGPDKLNQLRHVEFFRDDVSLAEHMERHAALLRPKFQAVERTLQTELAGEGVATWTKPQGGYFVSFDCARPIADAVVELCGRAGVKLTPAGATFPYGADPGNANIRIAPTFASTDDVASAVEVLCCAVLAISAGEAV